jgi:transposase InsO family protein
MAPPRKYSDEVRHRAIDEVLKRGRRIKLHSSWRSRSIAEAATIDWIAWYNDTRLHGEIGHVPPAEYEANWSTIKRALEPAPNH